MTSKFSLKKIKNKIFKKSDEKRWDSTPPYEYVQKVTEHSVHKYLNLDKSEIKNWCIVGGYLGEEIVGILNNYPNVTITIFECSKRYAGELGIKFANNSKVKVIEKAVSNVTGKINFFETNLTGAGSILKVGAFAMESYDAKSAEFYEVESITLDDFFGTESIDVLQIDVQGAEKHVIDGAENILKKTKAIFTEISVKPHLYENSVVLNQLNKELESKNFTLALLGTDFNLTGNALYVRNDCVEYQPNLTLY